MNQSPPTPEPLLSALAGARQYSDDLLRLPNVIGVGAAYKSVGGRRTDTYCVIVYVNRKESPANLGSLQRVPRDLLDAQQDAVAVQGSQRDRLEDQHVERALQDIHLFAHDSLLQAF